MHPSNVACPVCLAGPGRPCTNYMGYPTAQIHDARIDRAR